MLPAERLAAFDVKDGAQPALTRFYLAVTPQEFEDFRAHQLRVHNFLYHQKEEPRYGSCSQLLIEAKRLNRRVRELLASEFQRPMGAVVIAMVNEDTFPGELGLVVVESPGPSSAEGQDVTYFVTVRTAVLPALSPPPRMS